MKTRYLLLTSFAALSLAACGDHKDGTAATNDTAVAGGDLTGNDGALANDAMTTNDAVAASPDQAFANAAAASDAFEIATSKLALTQGSSAKVKAFAQKMIDAHTASTAKLKTAVASASPALTPDPALNAEQQASLTALQGATGTDFDRAYIDAQIKGHQTTLDTLKAFSATGGVPALKTFATGLIPTVTAHLNMANGLRP